MKDPKRRYTAIQAYNHPWVQQQVEEESKNLVINPESIQGIDNMLQAQQMKKTMLLYLATFIPEKEVQDLKQLFIKIDKNGNGMLSLDEMIEQLTMFKQITNNQNIDKEYLTALFHQMDIDQSGQIDYSGTPCSPYPQNSSRPSSGAPGSRTSGSSRSSSARSTRTTQARSTRRNS